MKKFKKLTIITVKAILIIVLAVILNKIFMPKYITENQDGRITQEYYPQARYSDVIFVGSSTVFSGISPVELWRHNGISSFVRANASQTMWISYYMIEDALKVHKPELVCLDMTFIKYDDDFVEEPSTRKSLDGMRLSSSKIGCIEASMGSDEKLMDYLVPLFRFHSRWKELTRDDFRYAFYNTPVTFNGFIKDEEVEPADKDVLVYSKEGETPISSRNLEYLRRSIELCQRKGVQIMLFKVPAFSDNWGTDYDRQIGDIAAEYGISYVNFDEYNDDIGLDYKTDTPDMGSHLNTSGAVKFSEYLGDHISSGYKVSDRREDTRYVKNWDEIISRYNK
jgi:hypothetical protein